MNVYIYFSGVFCIANQIMSEENNDKSVVDINSA